MFKEQIIKHAPTLLRIGASIFVGLTVAAAISDYKKYEEKVEEAKAEKEAEAGTDETAAELTNKEKAVIALKCYWRTGCTVFLSIALMWMGSHIDLTRAAKDVAAGYGVVKYAEDQLEKRGIATEKIVGKAKADAIKAEAAAECVCFDDDEISIARSKYSGTLLCKDLFTGMWFYTDSAKLERAMLLAQNIYAECGIVSLEEFYGELDLDIPGVAGNVGWDSAVADGVGIDTDYIKGPTGDPCCVISYPNIKALY